MEEFSRIKRLPPYVFAVVNDLKYAARQRGEDIIDFGMGNPDGATPQHIVDKLVESVVQGKNHRYSVSKGIQGLRKAVCGYYKRRFDVDLDPETEAIVTIGSKEGLSHLALAISGPGDTVLVPNPTYPLHAYSFIIAGADVQHIPIGKNVDFFDELTRSMRNSWPKPKGLVVNFPSNPTARVVDLSFYEKIVAFAKEHNIWVISDIAYAELCFDGYKAPSILQVPGAKDVAVEFYTVSKTYNMPGWRVGFAVGNKQLVYALTRMKSYLDYGLFQPIQIAATVALNGPQDCVDEIRELYQSRRNLLVDGLQRAGWQVEKPLASMFIWAEIPEPFRHMGSLEFTKKLLTEAQVAVSPGIGFGQCGDTHVRIALIENEHRTRQAIRNIRKFLNAGGDVSP
ncbi:MAG: alanine transaminase [Magnetococcales bacterium]|nr:alanine transaminase [Magnetococcales bacterium]NGZ29098.1 alanine transaminase [Magnetococcales bacterium]